MSEKTKTETVDQIVAKAQQAGVGLMAVAATFGMVNPSDHDKRVILPSQPVFSLVNEPTEQGGSTLRREREEAGPHYISYTVAQRTPGRSGKA